MSQFHRHRRASDTDCGLSRMLLEGAQCDGNVYLHGRERTISYAQMHIMMSRLAVRLAENPQFSERPLPRGVFVGPGTPPPADLGVPPIGHLPGVHPGDTRRRASPSASPPT